MDFETWFKDLTSDEIWFIPASMHHKDYTFKEISRKVYMGCVADRVFKSMSECRKHVYNIICKTPGDKPKGKPWYEKALEAKLQQDATKEEWKPVSEEERQRRLAEFKALVDNLPMINNFPRVSRKEEEENCDWIPKKDKPFVRSEVQVMEAVNQHVMKVINARRKYYLSAYPDATEEEIQAYLNKFDVL